MLGMVARFSSSKGMVRVPDLTGLTVEQANAALVAAGLKRSATLLSSGTTSNSSLDGKVSEQTITAGQLVDYETAISYRSLIYVAPPPPAAPPPTITYGSCVEYSFLPNGTFCSGQKQCSGGGVSYRRAKVFSNGVWTGGYSECATSISGSSCSYVDGACGYTAPVVCTGTAGCNTYTSSCSGGSYYVRTRCWDACGNDTSVTRKDYSCCSAGLVSCTSWSGFSGGQSRTCTYRRSDCSTYTTTETRCTASTKTTCGTCTPIYPGATTKYKTCTKTTTSTSCSTSTSTYSQSC